MTLKTTQFDVVDFIKAPEDAVEYLKAVMEDGNSDEIRAALNNIIRAEASKTSPKKPA
jgi:DNA-binding phage protein